jgi:two-component system sensor histidine kinase KdpD
MSRDDKTGINPEESLAEIATVPEVRLLAAISGSGSGEQVVGLAAQLAGVMGARWHAVFIETPRSARDPAVARRAAEALSLAVRHGATVSNEPDDDVASGLAAHLAATPADHLVVGTRTAANRHRWFRRSTVSSVQKRLPGLTVHIAPAGTAVAPVAKASAMSKQELRHHVIALGLVAITLGFAELASQLLGGRPLNLLFLFPVIAAAARFGMGPALTATAASVLGFDFFLLRPRFHLEPTAPVIVVTLTALLSVAIYTSLLTQALRSRVALSDRSAKENARIASFSQVLARAASWEETAKAVRDEIADALKAEAAVFRERNGRLEPVGTTMEQLSWGPIDQAALDWCWEHGEAAGRGTTAIASAVWRVEPLRTSLGVLAVLAFVRHDGRDPIRADRGGFSTLWSVKQRLRTND